MNDIGVKLNGDELEVTNGKTQQCFRLPFHLANQANIDQWYCNLHRQVQYASNNVGWTNCKEDTKTILKTAMSDGEVREAVERNKSFWEGSAEGACEKWFYDNKIDERPTEDEGEDEDEDEIEKNNWKWLATIAGRMKNSWKWLATIAGGMKNNWKWLATIAGGMKNSWKWLATIAGRMKNNWKWLATIAGGILLLLAAYFYLSNQTKSPGKTLAEQGEDAKQMINNCVKIAKNPGSTLENFMGDDAYFMVYYPFKDFVDETVAAGGPANGKTIEEATLAELERNLRDWELRCGCDLTIDCPELGIID